MKVLIVNNDDIRSGAGRAAYRLHKALILSGIDSIMLVQDKLSDDYTVKSAVHKHWKYWKKLLRIWTRWKKSKYQIKNSVSFSLADSRDNLNQIVSKYKPDIIHFHWFNMGFIRLESLKELRIPIVWTLHDMWAFTGGCHYNQNCEKYKKACGSCPILNSNKKKDLSYKIFNRKRRTYQAKDKMIIITPSNWLGKCAQGSVLLGRHQVKVVPNCIDTNLFKPIDKNNCS